MTGTITCNRDAEAFVETAVNQVKSGHTALAYGFSDDPIACSTTPTEWTVLLSNGSGRFTGGNGGLRGLTDRPTTGSTPPPPS